MMGWRVCGMVALAFALSACGGGGDGGSSAVDDVSARPAATRSDVGPGDVDRFYPATVGNMWMYEGVNPSSNAPTGELTNLTIQRSEAAGTILNVWVEERSYDASGTHVGVDMFAIDKGGATFVKSTSGEPAADKLLEQVGEYRDMLFPAVPGGKFLAFDKTGLDFGLDVDGDGLNDTVDMRMEVKVLGHETVVVPAGTFTGATKFEKQVVQRFTLTKDRSVQMVRTTALIWYAPGVGAVKTILTLKRDGQPEFSTAEQLRYYNVDGRTGGVPDVSGNLGGFSGSGTLSTGAWSVGGVYMAQLTAISVNPNTTVVDDAPSTETADAGNPGATSPVDISP